MPLVDLNADIAELESAVSQSETVDASAIALINGIPDLIQAAVDKALADDDAADEGTVQAVRAAIANVKSRLTATDSSLSAAVAANTPSAEQPPAPQDE